MPTIIHTLQGKVTGIWGTARMRGTDGKMQPMHMGETVQRGDVILTSQDGIVRLSSDEGYPTRHGDLLERALAALNDRSGAPATGLNGGDGGDGDGGNLTPGLRVE